MKKLINDPLNVVPEMLRGLVQLDHRIDVDPEHNIVFRADLAEFRLSGKVAIISGGGAGHEPAHAGYVGPGMLTAAVVGDVFTSPSVDAVLAAIRLVTGDAGVLLIIKNYTGDRLNFGLAAELARAEGYVVEMVVVADDVAIEQQDASARRGIAGTVFIHKLAGAAADASASLTEVRAVAQMGCQNVASMGVALTSCTVPAVGKRGFELGEDEIEFGLGIHGERGVRKSHLAPAKTIVAEIFDRIVTCSDVQPGDSVALLVNNLGNTTSMELTIVADAAVSDLSERGLTVTRAWSGTLLTALDMAGVSLSILRLEDNLVRFLDAPASTSAWPTTSGKVRSISSKNQTGTEQSQPPLAARGPRNALTLILIDAVARAVIDGEPLLTELDQKSGDGDHGLSMTRAARALLANADELATLTLPEALQAVAHIVRRSMAGSSGPLYAIGLMRASSVVSEADIVSWSDTLLAAAAGLSELGQASEGDRTLLDALIPAARALAAAEAADLRLPEAFNAAAFAARGAADHTAQMLPRRGRASYLGARAVGSNDPGAEGVAIWLGALASALLNHWKEQTNA